MAEAQHAHEKPAHGTICWNELATKDSETAKKFYSDLFGWTFKTSDAAGMQYNEIYLGDAPFGGLYEISPEMGPMPPSWTAYIAVDDVDATTAQVTEKGGSVRMGPMDIPNVGRFSVIADPTGATIALITLGGKG